MNENLRNVITPRKLEHPLEAYWLAPSGEGPLAAEWSDKPHRLLYDLIAALLPFLLTSTVPPKVRGPRGPYASKPTGRPVAVDPQSVVQWRRNNNATIRQTASHFDISTATVKRYAQLHKD
jgi:hypothetical protein